MLGPRTRWWWWVLPAAAAGLMTAALVLSAAHWTSDVVGGALLALALVTVASRWPWRAGASGTRDRGSETGCPAAPTGGAVGQRGAQEVEQPGRHDVGVVVAAELLPGRPAGALELASRRP